MPLMDTATFRDIAQVVPAVALAAAGQVAAAALGQCARLLDEHGSTANVLARHAARNAAYYTGDLSQQVAENAHVYASRAAHQAQRQAQRVHSITDTLASVLEATVQTATHAAQRTARRQATRAATFADDQAIAANYAMQSLVGRLPGFVPRGSSGATSDVADSFVPWADIPPNGNASTSAAASQAAASVPTFATHAATNDSSLQASAAAADATSTMQDGCSAQHPQHVLHGLSAAAAPAAVTAAAAAGPDDTIAQLQADLTATQEVLADTVAALENAHIQLAVKQLTADVFRSVERKAADEQLQQLHRALLQSSADLAAARQQLAAATDTVAALPQQMVCMVQNQMRRAMREGMVELMREALASPEPGMHAATAVAAVSGAGSDLTSSHEAHAGGSSVFAVPAGQGSVATAHGWSPTATAEAAVDAADYAACTSADQAAATCELAYASGLSAVQFDALTPEATSAGTTPGAPGTDSFADECQKSSDDDAFVMVDAATDSN